MSKQIWEAQRIMVINPNMRRWYLQLNSNQTLWKRLYLLAFEENVPCHGYKSCSSERHLTT